MPHLSVDDIAVSPCESYACAFVGVLNGINYPALSHSHCGS